MYTSHGHKQRLLKELKAQGNQRIQRRFVRGVGLTQTFHNRRLESGKVSIVLGIQTLLLDKLPQPLDQIEIG